MEIKKLDTSVSEELRDLFVRVYNDPPWNDQWTAEKAEKYLNSFIDNPLFIGYSAFLDGQQVGGCFGTRKYWWTGDEYNILEFFIDNSFHRQGLGSTFMELIRANIEQNNIKTITLLTLRDTPADRFYSKVGFKDHDRLVFKSKSF